LVEDNDVITGELCHIKAKRPNGPRYDAGQSEEERHGPGNLILLCSRHHKVVDSDPRTYTAVQLSALKREREANGPVSVTPAIARKADLFSQHYTFQVQGEVHVSEIHAETVTFRISSKSKKPITQLPADVVGGSSAHRSYLKYLIDRYNEFAKEQEGREFHYGVVYTSIKRKFKTDWEWIPISRFEEAVDHIQAKIHTTIIGRQRKAKKQSSYEDFTAYLLNHRKQKI